MSDSDLIAAFLAKGGAVKKVPEGHRTISEKEMYQLVRGNDPDYIGTKPRDEERITVVTDHCGREFYKNEAGGWL